jgi:hypothetical protein
MKFHQSTNQQHSALILRVWPLILSSRSFRLYTHHVMQVVIKGVLDIVLGNVGQDVKWQIDWVCLSKRLLSLQRYTSGIMF